MTRRTSPKRLAGTALALVIFASSATIAVTSDDAYAQIDAGVDSAPVPAGAIDVRQPTTGSDAEVVARLAALADALAKMKAGSTPDQSHAAAIFAILASGTWLLLAILKRASGMTSRGKKWLPRVAAGLGVATGLLTYLGAGQPMIIAILYGAGPPLASAIQELWKSRSPGGAAAASA